MINGPLVSFLILTKIQEHKNLRFAKIDNWYFNVLLVSHSAVCPAWSQDGPRPVVGTSACLSSTRDEDCRMCHCLQSGKLVIFNPNHVKHVDMRRYLGYTVYKDNDREMAIYFIFNLYNKDLQTYIQFSTVNQGDF